MIGNNYSAPSSSSYQYLDMSTYKVDSVICCNCESEAPQKVYCRYLSDPSKYYIHAKCYYCQHVWCDECEKFFAANDFV
ncbi:uncharacterized protein ASCRUDRAFT_75260 [Ascoidea rubescens DSM 1968]|uniref:Uncharacterized protein n=1 Tax=Ascoidea rubescens DSM 1968 TaxID=1344418 RepID=A0A1D2VKB1_9ASCO|nr:hypothetical protein ASCRUDRAFT_75260 [Ascoidea rubescens DSM 1968]ODV62038.1 hypothetical protein ASCRUDRAFT_75260 [Ascoidea rubescens DSM 1968]